MACCRCEVYLDWHVPWHRDRKWSIWVVLVTLLPVCAMSVRVDEQRLLDAMMSEYNTAARPVYNASQTVTVKFGLTLIQIYDMDEVNQVLTINVWLEQEWEDERLVWDPQDYNGLEILRIPCEKIWLPDIVLYNSADDFTTGYMKSKAMVTSTGNVFWPPPAKFRSSCKIDITYFPFDDQECELKFGSWTYDGFQVDITNRSAQVDLTNYVFSGEWELIDVRVRRTEMYYACCEEPYPDVRFTIIIRRKTLYYLFNIIFPCLWLTILSLLGFWLPPDSGEKITLGITVLLAFSVFMLLIAESMPATSEFVPLIGIYLTVTMAMTSMSIILTVFVLQLHHVGPHQKRVPRWMWTLVIEILAPIVCLCHVSQRYRYLSAKLSKTGRRTQHQYNKGRDVSRPEEFTMNPLAADTASFAAGRGRGRGRGNCNGIIVSGGASVVGQSGQEGGGGGRGGEGGSSVEASAGVPAGRPLSNVEMGYADHKQLDGGGGEGGRHVTHNDKDSASDVSTAHSLPAPSLHPHNHTRDLHGKRASSGAELPSSSRAAGPARRDPQWRPGEHIVCGGNSRAPGGSQTAATNGHDGSGSDASRRADGLVASTTPHVQHRVAESERDAGPGATLSADNTYYHHQERHSDVTYPRLPGVDQAGVCETSLAFRGQAPTVDLPPEKSGGQAREAYPTAHYIRGQAPPTYQGRHAQPSASGIDYHVASGHPASSLGGRDLQSERITQHLQVLVSRDDEDEYHQDVVTEWRVVAHVMDRLLFWLFLLVAIVSSVIILIVKPLTKPETWRNE
ncbi:acetylcholine receptor subunit alpha-like 2 [Littorina saxatilis]|uniref:acetylcholine receptor subunit alpha-like 2 n=1 Tax=Littorina saxatilis TaxID=31220 RepID=UPI0038B48743